MCFKSRKCGRKVKNNPVVPYPRGVRCVCIHILAKLICTVRLLNNLTFLPAHFPYALLSLYSSQHYFLIPLPRSRPNVSLLFTLSLFPTECNHHYHSLNKLFQVISPCPSPPSSTSALATVSVALLKEKTTYIFFFTPSCFDCIYISWCRGGRNDERSERLLNASLGFRSHLFVLLAGLRIHYFSLFAILCQPLSLLLRWNLFLLVWTFLEPIFPTWFAVKTAQTLVTLFTHKKCACVTVAGFFIVMKCLGFSF